MGNSKLVLCSFLWLPLSCSCQDVHFHIVATLHGVIYTADTWSAELNLVLKIESCFWLLGKLSPHSLVHSDQPHQWTQFLQRKVLGSRLILCLASLLKKKWLQGWVLCKCFYCWQFFSLNVPLPNVSLWISWCSVLLNLTS